MEKMLKKLEKWFEINLGWFFVNGRNREWWENYLKEKYGKGNNSNSL